jgi:hypothetical protein
VKEKGPEDELKELPWFPIYPDKFFSSRACMKMEDYQRGWYIHLLLLMTRSKPLGYLPLDGQLWRFAGAHNRQFYDEHAAVVMACFKIREFDGQRWIYNERLLTVLHQQDVKHKKAIKNGKLNQSSVSISYSLEFKDFWENHVWKCVNKKNTVAAFEKSLAIIAKEQKLTPDLALKFLIGAADEFRQSDAGREHGLFPDYQPPYPATWLNGQRFFDDRATWNLGKSKPGARDETPATVSRTVADPNCAKCNGSGWVAVPGKHSVERCECWKANRKKLSRKTGQDE